jgi:neutral ceramidase
MTTSTQLEAGVAAVTVTPPVGTDLSGYAGRKGPATGVHDELYAKTLVLRQNGKTCLLITTDLIGLGAAIGRDIRRRIRERTGIPSTRVIIVSSHTHSGPATDVFPVGIAVETPDPRYIETLKQRIVESVEAAIAMLQPATIGCARTSASVNVNRKTVAGSFNLQPNPDGVVDREVGVVRITRPDGRVLAHLVNYACHGVVLGSRNLKISADYPGVVQRAMEEAFGGVTLFTNGACGNINPIVQGGTFTDVKRLGGEVAAAAVKISPGIETFPDPAVSMRSRVVALPYQRLSERALLAIIKREECRQVETAGTQANDAAGAVGVMWLAWARAMLKRRRRGAMAESAKLTTRVLTIGPLALVAIPAEVFAETGLIVKQASPYAFTYVLGYADGLVGYLPTREAMRDGGYETWAYIAYGGRPFQATAESVLRRDVQSLLASKRRSRARK